MSDGGLPPITVSGGKLKGGVASLPGDISSQFVTAILMVAPFAEKDVTVRVTTPLESKPYVLMTMDAMQWFGVTVGFDEAMREFQIFPQKYQPTKFSVEGDWTSASYPLAAGALAGRVQVTNLPAETMQGDRMIVDFIREMGGRVSGGHGWFTVSQSSLRPLAADLSDCIDLLPTAAILAAVADGTSRLTGLKRARIKESDRVQAVAEGLKNMDILVDEEPDSLTIVGGTPRGAVIDSKGDHRIAMAFSLLGAVAGETIIEGAECVSKTYPEFWDMLTLLGGKVQLGK
jgi:3-phosphoshikimate 1-carboxyvinyltransferase